jgi:hypothetical protein
MATKGSVTKGSSVLRKRPSDPSYGGSVRRAIGCHGAPVPLTEDQTARAAYESWNPGPLTEANRLNLYDAETGVPFFNAGKGPSVLFI